MLFPVGDAEALAQTLASLLDDPGRRAELVAHASAAVAAYDWPMVAQRVLEVYTPAIEASPGGRRPARPSDGGRRAPGLTRHRCGPHCWAATGLPGFGKIIQLRCVTMWVVVTVVVAVVLVATYVTWTATRVDRLHARADAAFAALDAQSVRRAAATVDLAGQDGMAEAAGAAAKAVLAAPPDDRESAENDLTRALREAVAQAGTAGTGTAGMPAVAAASRRLALARQVHSDLVRDALAVRRRPLVRLLRLARAHPVPRFFDIDEPTLDPPHDGAQR